MSSCENKKLKVKCPHCKNEFLYYSSEFRPFCTERCKMVDLGHWLEGAYAIPVISSQLDDDSEFDSDKDHDED